jgi:probable addiction module antidote protein
MQTTKFDITDYLKTEEDIQRYLNGVFEENDPQFIPIAIGDVARARKKMANVAKSAGIARSNAYRALSEGSNPAFATVAKALNALGYRFSTVPLTNSAASQG